MCLTAIHPHRIPTGYRPASCALLLFTRQAAISRSPHIAYCATAGLLADSRSDAGPLAYGSFEFRCCHRSACRPMMRTIGAEIDQSERARQHAISTPRMTSLRISLAFLGVVVPARNSRGFSVREPTGCYVDRANRVSPQHRDDWTRQPVVLHESALAGRRQLTEDRRDVVQAKNDLLLGALRFFMTNLLLTCHFAALGSSRSLRQPLTSSPFAQPSIGAHLYADTRSQELRPWTAR